MHNVAKLHLPGLGTVLEKCFETKEAPKHFPPIITILKEKEWATIDHPGYLLLKCIDSTQPFDCQLWQNQATEFGITTTYSL